MVKTKGSWVTVVAILLSLSVASLTFAAAKQITGQVVSVSPMAKTLTVKTADGPVAFHVEESAVPVLAELKPGDSVTVVYSEGDGGLTVHSIRKS